jgi:hypothetical protein
MRISSPTWRDVLLKGQSPRDIGTKGTFFGFEIKEKQPHFNEHFLLAILYFVYAL